MLADWRSGEAASEGDLAIPAVPCSRFRVQGRGRGRHDCDAMNLYYNTSFRLHGDEIALHDKLFLEHGADRRLVPIVLARRDRKKLLQYKESIQDSLENAEIKG